MIESFDCPSCGGPLEYKGGNDKTTRCPFCLNSVIVPKELRAHTADLLHINIHPSRSPLPIIILVSVGLIIFAVVLAVILSRPNPTPPPFVVNVPQPPQIPTPTPTPRPKPDEPAGFASIVMTFGSEGIGPGLFTDARSIAVDGAGNIYVGEYGNGRIQVFDGEGKFINQWMADTKMPLRGMAADRKGIVYIAQRGIISRYEGATGKMIGQLQFPEGRGFDDVAVTADGGLVTAWFRVMNGISFGSRGDNIVRFDAGGRAVRTIRDAISQQTDSAELDTRVAADGLGNIYALGTFNNAVFKFTPEGKFVNKFGGAGDQPGQFRAPDAIAVDGQGRVYVSDFNRVQVFDTNGRYIDQFKAGGVASGMAFNDKNELFVASRSRVVKLVINKP
ncbi:MAG: NHL repeat-containing protein [Blastocatellia bacterium]